MKSKFNLLLSFQLTCWNSWNDGIFDCYVYQSWFSLHSEMHFSYNISLFEKITFFLHLGYKKTYGLENLIRLNQNYIYIYIYYTQGRRTRMSRMGSYPPNIWGKALLGEKNLCKKNFLSPIKNFLPIQSKIRSSAPDKLYLVYFL